jgi:hypothetical protein
MASERVQRVCAMLDELDRYDLVGLSLLALKQGRQGEREAIVAYLLQMAEVSHKLGFDTHSIYQEVARDIENGEHRKEVSDG